MTDFERFKQMLTDSGVESKCYNYSRSAVIVECESGMDMVSGEGSASFEFDFSGKFIKMWIHE